MRTRKQIVVNTGKSVKSTQIEDSEAEGKSLFIDWYGSAAKTEARHINQLIIQTHMEEFYISVFALDPPVTFGSPEEQKWQLRDVDSISPDCVARLVMSPDMLKRAIDVLQKHLEKYHASIGVSKTAKTDQIESR